MMRSALLPTLILGVFFAGTATATTNLVQNGDFSSSTTGPGTIGYSTELTDWTLGFLKGSGKASPKLGAAWLYGSESGPHAPDTLGLPTGPYGTGRLWGPNSGSNNGLADSPGGGNFVGLSGGVIATTLTQDLTKLVLGRNYVVTFDYAVPTNRADNRGNTQYLTVGLGNQKQNTAPWTVAARGFDPWTKETLTFKDVQGSNVLSFFNNGMPGYPPVALIDDVSVTFAPVPEPAIWATMILGFVGLGALARRRRTLMTVKRLA